MKTLFLLIFLLPLSVSSQVQDSISVNNPKEIFYDLNSAQEIVPFHKEMIEDYKNDDDFNYVELKKTDSLWIRFKNWIGQIITRFFKWLLGVDEFSGFWQTFFTILPYISILAILSLLGWLFMKVNPKNILSEPLTPPQVILSEEEDIIQNQDIQQLIEKALEQKNYRLAIRYSYLYTLKKLSESERIKWESQKTNMDYIREIDDVPLKNEFKKITRLYNFIWYGSFEIDEKSYYKAEQKFKSLTNTLTD